MLPAVVSTLTRYWPGTTNVRDDASEPSLVSDADGVLYHTSQNANGIYKTLPDGSTSILLTANFGNGALFDLTYGVVGGVGKFWFFGGDRYGAMYVMNSASVDNSYTFFAGGVDGNCYGGCFREGVGSEAGFNPGGRNGGHMTVDPTGTYLYVADTWNHRIRKVVIATRTVSTLAGSGQNAVLDGVGSAAQFSYPWDITHDAQGNLYVADGGGVRKVTPAGVVTTLATTGFATATSLAGASAIASDSKGNLYLAHFLGTTLGSRVLQISPQGVVSHVAGGAAYGTTNGVGTNAKFLKITSMTVTPQDVVYVLDQTDAGNWGAQLRRIVIN
jgi:hypothetical protein